MGVAQEIWAAEVAFSNFEGALEDLIGEFDSLGHDHYDGSLEIYGAADDVRLGIEAQTLIRGAGFHKVFVNHGPKIKGGSDGGRWETHYTFGDAELPVRGWRRRYVSDAASDHDRVIVGDPDPGYWEISYWPEGWNNARSLADLEAGHYRIVPDPLKP